MKKEQMFWLPGSSRPAYVLDGRAETKRQVSYVIWLRSQDGDVEVLTPESRSGLVFNRRHRKIREILKYESTDDGQTEQKMAPFCGLSIVLLKTVTDVEDVEFANYEVFFIDSVNKKIRSVYLNVDEIPGRKLQRAISSFLELLCEDLSLSEDVPTGINGLFDSYILKRKEGEHGGED